MALHELLRICRSVRKAVLFFSREIFNGDEVVVGIDWEWHLFFRFCYFSFSRFSSSATTALGVSSSLFTDGSATVSFSFFSAFSAVFFPSALVLRGRPGLRLVDSGFSSVSFVLSTVGWAGTTAVFQW